MKKTDYVNKIPPCPAWDIAGIESWLEDMAAEGLIFKWTKLGELVFVFRKGAPQSIRYRLEPVKKRPWFWWMSVDPPEEQQLRFYEDFGWKYVCRYTDFFIYYSAEPDAAELDTDPAIQAVTMGYLKKRGKRSLIFTVLIEIPILAFFLFFYFALIAQHGTLFTSLMCIHMLFFIIRDIYVNIKIHQLVKQLSAGQPMPHRKDWRSGAKKHHVSTAVFWCGAAILLVCCMQYIMVDRLDFGQIPQNQWKEPVPFVTYAELAPDDGSVTVTQLSDATVRQWSDPLIPVNYDWLDGGVYQYPGESKRGNILDLQYHETVSPFIARQIAENNLRFSWLRYQTEPVALPELGFDFAAAYYNEWGMDAIVIQHGSITICVTLGSGDEHGNFTTENWVTLMQERLLAAQ